ncbi:MAG: [Fe-Fe] hydrogenase large subunit C-terminal domain-containing protein, partial [Bacteroidota bacterium]
TDNLAPIVSPMIAMTKVVKMVYGPETRVVYIGPLISPKHEAVRYDGDARVDAVLTFTELRSLFREFGIHESKLEYSEFDPPLGRAGSLFPISKGFLEAAGINQDVLGGNVITAEGNKESLRAVRSFERHIDRIQKHFNLYYDEGIIMGPGMSSGGDKHLRNALVEQYSAKRLRNLDTRKWEEEMNKFGMLDLSRSFIKDDQRLPEPDEGKVKEILKLLGKEDKPTDDGCESCGFESCRSFAKAIAQGLSRTDLCQDFVIRNKNNYISTLRDTTTRQQEEISGLKTDLKKLNEAYELASDKLETSRAIMNQIPSGVVIVDEKLKVLSSNRSFIELLGPEAQEIDDIIPGLRGADMKTLVPVQFYKLFQNVLSTGENILSRDVQIGEALLNLSVFSIRKNKVVGGIVRDMYSPEVRNEQIIQRVTEVIDQNLAMVQQIGFLLGEGASKTEAMLNSIIQLHGKKEKRS